MRRILNPQLKIGEVDIGAIEFDPRSRDDIPQLLRGLQFIYTTAELRERVFRILKEVVPQREEGTDTVDVKLGRPGMEQWRILVLGVLRLALNADYDRVLELANEHLTVRRMLGHSGWTEEETLYNLQTLKDNLRLFTPEILERINRAVVESGRELLKKNSSAESPTASLNARVDSFVVETDVHYPTDVNLLWDAIRKTIQICARLTVDSSEWRQSEYNQSQFKRKLLSIQRLKRSNSKDEVKREAKQEEIREAHGDYIDVARGYLERADATRRRVEKEARGSDSALFLLEELNRFMEHARRQIEQIDRRVLQGKVIPQDEKVFSLFEPHTDWISKGKAGVPQELGLGVCVVEDENGFVLTHKVMEKLTDSEIAVPMVQRTQALYGELASVSFDCGFHSPENQETLKELVDQVVLPKKGKLTAVEQETQSDPEFVRLRKQHSAVESAINALEVHGLDRCLDHGIEGFKRYVALAVVARNLLKVGAILRQRERDRRRGPYKKAA